MPRLPRQLFRLMSLELLLVAVEQGLEHAENVEDVLLLLVLLLELIDDV